MTIYTTITVDWEGYNLQEANIKAMEQFNTTFSALPITHFICPAYISRLNNQTEISKAVNQINRAIKNIDELALHVHSWYSLVRAAGIHQPITNPCYMNPDIDVDGDSGYSVPLGCYTIEQIRNIIRESTPLLKGANVKNADAADAFKSFRCGGWLAGDNVLGALQQAGGFMYEASGISKEYYEYLHSQITGKVDKLLDWVVKIWGEISRQTLPIW